MDAMNKKEINRFHNDMQEKEMSVSKKKYWKKLKKK